MNKTTEVIDLLVRGVQMHDCDISMMRSYYLSVQSAEEKSIIHATSSYGIGRRRSLSRKLVRKRADSGGSEASLRDSRPRQSSLGGMEHHFVSGPSCESPDGVRDADGQGCFVTRTKMVPVHDQIAPWGARGGPSTPHTAA